MEELHVNGVREQQTPLDVPTNKTEENVPNDNDDVFQAESASQSPLKVSNSLKSSREERISSGENEPGEEKKYTYVIRSRTSVEEYSTSSESTEEPSSPKRAKLVIRSRSTDETTEFEKLEKEDEKVEEVNSLDDDMTQAIAVQANQMVRSLIEKIENEEMCQNEHFHQEAEVPKTETLAETSVQEEKQGQEQAADNNAEEQETDKEKLVPIETTSVKALSGDEVQSNADEKGDVETREKSFDTEHLADQGTPEVSICPVENRSTECIPNTDEEDTAEKMTISLDTQKGQSDEQTVATEDKTEVKLLQEEGTSEESEPKPDNENKTETRTMTFETQGEKSDEQVTVTVNPTEVILIPGEVKLEDNQSNVSKKGNAETIVMEFESQEEKSDEQAIVTVEAAEVKTLPEEVMPDESQTMANEETQAETMPLAFESQADKYDEQKIVTVETTDMKSLPEEVKSDDSQSVVDQERKVETMTMTFETQEEKSDDEVTAIVETSAVETLDEVKRQDIERKVDEENKPHTMALAFETQKEESDEQVTVTVETTEVKSIPEEMKPKESQSMVDEDNKADIMEMKFETQEEKSDEQAIITVETTEVETLPEEIKPDKNESKSDEESKAEKMTMTFETQEEKSDDDATAAVETSGLKSLLDEVKREEIEPKKDEGSKAETVALEFETQKEKSDEEMTVTVETTQMKSMPGEVKPGQSQSMMEEDSKADTLVMKFETQEENSDEQAIVTVEGTEVKSFPEEVKPDKNESKLDKESKAETMAMTFEMQEEKSDDDATAAVETTGVKSFPEEVKPDESQSMVESKADTMTLAFEKQEEKSDDQAIVTVEATELKSLPDEYKPEENESSVIEESKADTMAITFETQEEKSDDQASVTVEATEVTSLPEEQSDKEPLVSFSPSAATEGQEEPSSPKQEYVVEHFRQDSQTLHEFQEGNGEETEDKTQEKPIVKVRLAEEPFSNVTKENQYDDDVIELDTQVVDSPTEIALDTFEEGSDSDGEIDVTVERLSQENEQLIKEGESDEDGTPDDWMAKDDVDEIVFKGKTALEMDFEDTRQTEDEQKSQKTSETVDIETPKDIKDEVVFADTKAITVCSDIGSFFTPLEGEQAQETEVPSVVPTPEYDVDKEVEEETQRLISKNKIVADDRSIAVTEEILPNQLSKKEQPEFNILLEGELAQKTEVPSVVPAPEYDVDKEVEEETQRLISKNKVVADDRSIAVTEEILLNQQSRKEQPEFNILLFDEKEKDYDEEKPPSPVEAKKVTEEGITEIFETEELRRSGIFDDTLVEEDEDALKGQSEISQKDVVLANEEYFEAKEKEKHASLRWSLLEKWEEMNKRQSLEMKESETKAIVSTGTVAENETQGKHSVVTAEYEKPESERHFIQQTVSTETTPSSTTTVRTTKAMTTTKVIKARSEALPPTIKGEQAISEEEEVQNSIYEPAQAQSLQNTKESGPAFQEGPSHPDQMPEEGKPQEAISLQTDPCIGVIKDHGLATTSEEAKSVPQDEQPLDEPEQAASMSTILFRMDGTPVIIPPVSQEQPKPVTAERQEQRTQPSAQEDETETKPEPIESSQMSTILFRMDGTPFVVPHDPPEKSSPKLKAVNFNPETSVRPLSVNSVESVRGEREGVPPLAGEEESDIDDSSLHLAKHAHSGPSRIPTVSPVKEMSAPPSPRPTHPDHDDVNEDKKQDADSPLLDQSQPADAEKGQKCCTIL